MDRRQFIMSTTTAGLVSSLGLVDLPAKPTRPKKGMTLGFSTYGSKTLTTETAIDTIAQIGFDSIEITIWPGWDANPETMPRSRRKAIRKRLRDRGLRLTSLMEHLHIDNDQRSTAQRLERLRLAAELAHDLSTKQPPILQTTIGGGGKWADKRDAYIAELQQWEQVARKHDLVIAVKPHRGGAFSRPDEAAELLKKLGHPKRIRMCYDYSHYDFRDMTLEGTIQTSLPHVGHIAVKDVIRLDKGLRFVLPGQGGRINYTKLISLFHQGGYRRDVCVEVSGQVWSQPGYDPVQAAKSSYQHLAAAFTKANVKRAR